MRNRRDGKRIIWPDGYHNILPYVMPKRTEAEVSMTQQFDVTDLVKYMADRNEKEGTQLKIFHAICTAVARTVYHRPKLNYFISGKRYYERPDITLSFVVKQKFEDEADETLMFLKVEPDMNIDSISKLIIGDVKKVRKEKSNDLDKLMDFVGRSELFFRASLESRIHKGRFLLSSSEQLRNLLRHDNHRSASQGAETDGRWNMAGQGCDQLHIHH